MTRTPFGQGYLGAATVVPMSTEPRAPQARITATTVPLSILAGGVALGIGALTLLAYRLTKNRAAKRIVATLGGAAAGGPAGVAIFGATGEPGGDINVIGFGGGGVLAGALSGWLLSRS